MKSGILKLVVLSIPLVPLIAQAAEGTESTSQTWKIVKKPTNNFDTGESEPEGTGAKLRQDQQINDNTAAITTDTSTSTTASPTSGDAAPSVASAATEPGRMSYYEPGVTPPPGKSKKSKKSSTSGSAYKSTASSTRTYGRLPTDSYGSPPAGDTVTTSAPVAPLALDAVSHWKIHSGERLTDVMSRWTKAIGWQLTWEPEDMVALADLDIEDTFTGATGKVIDALNRNGTDMQAKFYAANKMLRVTVRK